MPTDTAPALVQEKEVLLGDEAVALAAIHSGMTTAYAYPGTPSTEILEYVIHHRERYGGPPGHWCANEKTALEEGLGASFAGRRALVAMKHVGLNVAMDPFVSGAIVSVHGGLVIAVADDPGMHSSQNEQDSRYLADFARVICLEPSTPQEAYDMTRDAFDLSERFEIPVVVRLVTRLAHTRAAVALRPGREENGISKVSETASWILLPVNARRQWQKLLDANADMTAYSEDTHYNPLALGEPGGLGVITTGIASNYFKENANDLDMSPGHLHIGAYPIPMNKIRQLVGNSGRLLVLEEGYPFVERFLRGLLPPSLPVAGKTSGEIPQAGELGPDHVRSALGLPERDAVSLEGFEVPVRPPQLCKGCPHRDAYGSIKKALADYDAPMVTSDIGCYTLGALPPYSAVETCVCMGASIGIAKGAVEAGYKPVVAVIGDSTFLHSGVAPLMDCAANDTNVTIIILDNESVAMTGNQPTLLPRSRLKGVVLGVGVDPDHVHVRMAHPKREDEVAWLIRSEVEHRGTSVIILVRECLEAVRKRKRMERVTS